MITPSLDKKAARKHLDAFAFGGLFIEVLGWNHPQSRKPLEIEADGRAFVVKEIAQLSGFRVFEVVSAHPGDTFPDSKTQNAVWKRVAQHSAENILIFLDATRERSAWLWMKREGSKTRPRRHYYFKGQPGDLFLSKLSALVVDLAELDEQGNFPITETARRVEEGLDIEAVTKAFFRDFQEEHAKLLEAIKGIPDARERHWYASVLLNRLMFIWFLQVKGFLDAGRKQEGKRDYLSAKLDESRQASKDRYFKFFLRDLFFEGFAKVEGDRVLTGTVALGNIPYLNGGLFLPHGIEARIEGESLHREPYAKIRIPDAVFADLFAVFKRYSWSLDDTPGSRDNEINPDVLGYIFEKYINQKEFGAYYTRPQITDYLCEKTIHDLVVERANDGHAERAKLHKAMPKAMPEPRRFADIADLLLHADGHVCQRVLQDILPRLSLLDPACGSGAFLVAALKTLLNLYTALIGRCEALNHVPILQWIQNEKGQHRAPVAYWLKKKIVTENLFGVDIMEEATEIAKLRLFLSLVASAETHDQLEPLPNIEFNILPGNSLVGLLRVDSSAFDAKLPTGGGAKRLRKSAEQARLTLAYEEALGFTTETTVAPSMKDRQSAHVFAKQAAKYDELVRRKNERIQLYKDSTSIFKDLASLKRDIDALKKEARLILDQLLLEQFQAIDIKFEQATWTTKAGKEGAVEKRALNIGDLATLKPFHWAYEFDDIIVNRGGFDAIITNPPWEIFKPNSKEFFEKYSETVTRNSMRVEDFEKEKSKILAADKSIREAWLDYLSSFPHQSAWFRASRQYENQIGVVNGRKAGSDINLYKLFTEQCRHLLSAGGRCGIVIPSGIYTDLGAVQLRKMLFHQTTITGLFGFENRKKLFEGVHSRFKFVVLTFVNSGKTKAFPVAFMRHDVRELAGFPGDNPLCLTPELIERLSPGSLSLMEFQSVKDVAIAEKLLRHPLLGDEVSGAWNVSFSAEFHMTNDSDIFETSPGKGRLPLYEGKMIWQFQHGYAQPRYWVDERKGRERILGSTKDTGQTLPYQGYRLGFRDVAANTNERTLIAALLPPGNFAGNTVPCVTTVDDIRLVMFVQSVLNSFSIDYLIRQKITNHCSFFYMNQLPVPRLTAKDADFAPLVERAARLVGTAPEFDALVQNVFGKKATHKTHGVTDPQDRLTLRAEIDALVARLYGLDEEEFLHILGTFPLVDAAVKSQTANAFRDLLRLGKFARNTLSPSLSS